MSIERLEPVEPDQGMDAIIFEFPGLSRQTLHTDESKIASTNPFESMPREEVCKWLSFLHTGIKKL